jgi:hypothetical protein
MKKMMFQNAVHLCMSFISYLQLNWYGTIYIYIYIYIYIPPPPSPHILEFTIYILLHRKIHTNGFWTYTVLPLMCSLILLRSSPKCFTACRSISISSSVHFLLRKWCKEGKNIVWNTWFNMYTIQRLFTIPGTKIFSLELWTSKTQDWFAYHF